MSNANAVRFAAAAGALAIGLFPATAGAVDAIVVGQTNFYGTQTNGGSDPTQFTLANPSFLGAKIGPVPDVQAASDTDNNRVLVYSAPNANSIGYPPTFVLGQETMTSGAENWPSARPSASSLNRPNQVVVAGSVIAVADTGNNRVLVWRSFPTTNFRAADVVIGQPNFTSNLPNAGFYTSQNSLNAPRGVTIIGNKLVIADTGNHRVLIYNSIPTTNNAPADVVLGQTTFYGRSPNGPSYGTPTANSFNYPWYLGSDAANPTRLAVADQLNNRILIWNTVPTSSTGANIVIGQTSFGTNTRATSATGLSSPRHVIFDGNWMFVADTGNNRALYYPTGPVTGAAATKVFGQFSLTSGYDPNRWGAPAGNTLSTPTSVLLQAGALYVTDSQNHRVLGYINAMVPGGGDVYANLIFGQFGVDNMGQSAAFPNRKAVDGTGFDKVACLAVSQNHVVVGDKYNSRVLVYDKQNPTAGPIAVIGQPSMTSHCHGYRPGWLCPAAGPATLNGVSGCAVDAQNRLYISSELDNRVLVYNTIPTTSGAAASYVIGQDTFAGITPNSGSAGAGWLSMPGALAVTPDNKLMVADLRNYRVLIYPLPITANRPLASVVIGHANFTNIGQEFGGTLTGLSSPKGMTVDSGGRLYVSELGRVHVFDSVPTVNGALASFNIGAARGAQWHAPTAGDLQSGMQVSLDGQINMAALDGYVFVPDASANRMLAFDRSTLAQSAAAMRVLGQRTFTADERRPYDTGGAIFGTMVGAIGFVVDPNGQHVWISEADGNRVIRVQRSELAKYTYVTGYPEDATCLGYDPTVYHAFAHEKWPIRAALQGAGGNVDAQYRPRPVPNVVDCLINRPSSAGMKSMILAQTTAVQEHFPRKVEIYNWTPAQRQDLQNAFAVAWNWYENHFAGAGNIPIQDPPTNVIPANEAPGLEEATTLLSWNDAWALYVSHLAQTLAAEYGGWFPWTVRGLDTNSQLALLDDYEMYQYAEKTTSQGYSQPYAGFQIYYGTDANNELGWNQAEGVIIPAPPSVELTYLLDNGILTPQRRKTLVQLMQWGRDLAHMNGWWDVPTSLATWQYPGFPPLSRVLTGTLNSIDPGQGVRHWTAGCHGTSGVFKAMMRAANIPVRYLLTATNPGTHSQLYFPTEQAFLSHSDDPYGRLVNTASYSSELLFIDYTKWNAWFGPVQTNVCDWWDWEMGLCEPEYGPNPNALNNVGRPQRELALIYLPGYLMGAYCMDLADGSTHATGRVYRYILGFDYPTVAGLEATGVYSSMDQKIAATPNACSIFIPQYRGF